MTNFRYFLALNHMPLIGPRKTMRLLERWPNLEECFNLPQAQLVQEGVPLSMAEQISNFNWKKLQADIAFEQQPNHTILTWEHPDYPPLLKEIHDPPPVLYTIGNLDCLKQPNMAIIGTRLPSSMGRLTAFEWAKELSLQNLTIVSGLARGIDTAAHEGCIQGSQKTIAVLGTGVNLTYPQSNRNLAHTITQNGLLLSEFPLNTPPKAGHFPRRNRIISGLSIATLVVEATLKSGSLLTARFALEQNRDVFALPGSIHLPQTQGCHHLLKQGASLVTCYQDVLTELGITAPSKKAQSKPLPPKDKDKVLENIDFEPTHINTIMTKSGLSLTEVISRLAELELNGSIHAVPGGYMRHETLST
jgi:DNA processing protein